MDVLDYLLDFDIDALVSKVDGILHQNRKLKENNELTVRSLWRVIGMATTLSFAKRAMGY